MTCLQNFFVILCELVMDTNSCAYEQGINALAALMEHSTLVSVSNSLKAIPERKFSVNEESSQERSKKSKWVCVRKRICDCRSCTSQCMFVS